MLFSAIQAARRSVLDSMPILLPQVNFHVKCKVCQGEIDILGTRSDHAGMARKVEKPLQLKLWLKYLGRKQGEVAKAIGIGASFMSQMVKGTKAPSNATFQALAKELGFENPMDLYELPPTSPPSPSELAAISRMRKDHHK